MIEELLKKDPVKVYESMRIFFSTDFDFDYLDHDLILKFLKEQPEKDIINFEKKLHEKNY